MIAYCTCGFPNQYTLTKPKFCQNCAKPMGGSFTSASIPQESKRVPQTKVINHPHRRTLDVYEDEEPQEYIPEITKLSFEIEGGETSSSQTLESLIFDNPIKPVKKPKRARSKIDKNAFSQIMAKAKSGTRGQDLE